jgi:hypothetical protein
VGRLLHGVGGGGAVGSCHGDGREGFWEEAARERKRGVVMGLEVRAAVVAEGDK